MAVSEQVLRVELETDPKGLGYRRGGEWLPPSQIGHLLVAGEPSRHSELGGGALDLHAVARIAHGGGWVDALLAEHAVTPEQAKALKESA